MMNTIEDRQIASYIPKAKRKEQIVFSKHKRGLPGPPTTGGGGRGPWPLNFLQKSAIPKFVDNRVNSL